VEPELSKKERVKEFLEYEIFKELEPADYYDNHGLWFPKQKPRVFKKGEIDRALKEVEKRLTKGVNPA